MKVLKIQLILILLFFPVSAFAEKSKVANAEFFQKINVSILSCFRSPSVAFSGEGIEIDLYISKTGRAFDIAYTGKKSLSALNKAYEGALIRAIKRCSPYTGVPSGKYSILFTKEMFFESKMNK